MGKFAEFSDVTIATDDFLDRGVARGSAAVILDDYGDGGYELQIFDEHGNTIGQFSAQESELAPAAPSRPEPTTDGQEVDA